MTILDELADYAKERTKKAKEKISLEDIRKQALDLPKGQFEFESVLKSNGISFICECKRGSPSKGVIAEYFPYMDIAKEYEAAGADCISVLTEPKWFLGKDEYLSNIAEKVAVPCLRKDFIVDEYMIYEAKVLGAKAVLLICSVLPMKILARYIEICDSLGLSALVEVHNEEEIELALTAKARVIGVNNRNLKDFSVDTNNSIRLREHVPENVLFVAESGVKTRVDVTTLEAIGVDAILIGESLMRAEDKIVKLNELRGVYDED